MPQGTETNGRLRPPRGKPCGVEGCGEITANGKPYCYDHLDLMQRADALIGEVNTRNAEIGRVLAGGDEGWRFVEINGSVAQDILGIIQVYGEQTIRAIARASSLKASIVEPYVKALAAHGLVRTYPYRVGCAIEEKVALPE